MSDIKPTRRDILIGGIGVAAATVLPGGIDIINASPSAATASSTCNAAEMWEPLDALDEGWKIGLEWSKKQKAT
jgi:hypothetical protein